MKNISKRINLKKGFVLMLILVIGQMIYGQQIPNIIPPSPEAASVFKFAEVPVSLYTGVPNISIPLFEIESGGVTIPISISYHSKGVQVAEIASRVGIGWTLNAGGMVSRQIRGRADDGPYGYLGMNNGTYTYKDNNGNVDFFTSVSKRTSIWNTDEHLSFDFIPDQFYFNTANGLSGKFIFDYTDGKILAQNYSNIKVEGGGGNGFGIIDGKGNRYLFGAHQDYDQVVKNLVLLETGTFSDLTFPITANHINTWHLNKIITQTGKEIEFSYAPEESTFYRRSHDKYENSFPASEYKSYVSKIRSFQHRITQITFDGGKLLFEYDTENRQDLLQGGNTLKKITLYDKKNTIVKWVIFEYEYTDSWSSIDNSVGSNANINHFYKGWDSEASKRLFLKSVQVKTANNQSLPPYEFDYNSQLLPSRHSNSQDVWGYYNGKNNGQFLREIYTDLGARAVDTVKSKAGLLEKITYPEGGSTRFYYEHNRVFNNYFPGNVIDYGNPNPVTTKETAVASPLDYLQTVIDPITNLPVYSQSEYIYRRTFIITDATIGANMKYNTVGSFCGTGGSHGCKFSAVVRDQNNNIVRVLHPTLLNEYRNINALPPGTYTLEVQAPTTHNPFPVENNSEEHFIVSLKWAEGVGSNEPIYAGGKRIKKIEYLDSQDNIELTKTYSYTDPASGKSSGMLFGLPNFLGIKTSLTSLSGNTFTILNPFGNVPGAPLSTYQGSSLGYGAVTEYIGEGSSTLGKSVHRYTMIPDTGLYYEFPYHPPVDNEWLRGKEESVIHYKKEENGSYSAVKKVINEYFYGDYMSPVVFNPRSYRRTLAGNYIQSSTDIQFIYPFGYDNSEELPHLNNGRMFRLPLAAMYIDQDFYTSESILAYKVYYLTGGALDLRKTKVTDYFDTGNEVVTETDYAYNYDKHYNPSTIEQTTNDNTTIKTEYKYPPELTSIQYVQAQNMDDKNIVDIPLITKTFRGNTKLSETAIEYKDWNNAAQPEDILLAPELIKTSKGENGSLEVRVRYNKYDAYGNPLELQQENGTLISYIWGYNHTQPVAKIENIAYNSIPTNLITAIHSATNESTMYNALTALQNHSALANAMVTTYTYIPLVGIKTMTDPKGYTTTYHYDSFNRLEKVTDMDGNILSENEYHYRTQN